MDKLQFLVLILFNPVKSHLITFGGSTPKAILQLNNDKELELQSNIWACI